MLKNRTKKNYINIKKRMLEIFLQPESNFIVKECFTLASLELFMFDKLFNITRDAFIIPFPQIQLQLSILSTFEFHSRLLSDIFGKLMGPSKYFVF